MDQNASNGPSKGSWREKLGLGNGKKDMPKIADEFQPMNDEPKLATKSSTTSPRPLQPVTKLAPMAPRTPGARSVPAPAKPAATKPAANTPSDGLADRLKAQRQAAEKLAEQRITIAREKAEARAGETPRAAQPSSPTDKPKFTFADEEIAAAKRETPASPAKDYPPALQKKSPAAPPPPMNGPTVTPPRPTLGGEKPIAAASTSAEPRRLQPQLSQAGHATTSGYRPLDPPNFQNVLKRSSTLQPPQQPSRGFTAQRPTFSENGFGDPRRREPVDEYRRRPEPSLRGEERPDVLRGEARRPSRGRRGDYDDDMADVFEEEEERPQRRRANARDYNQAYRDYEEGEHEEAPRRRSSGPLLILLAILVVAAVFVTGLWYYYFHMKPVAVTGDGQVPVISAPAEPAKVTPEATQDSSSTELSPASTAKKKIYDRILGEADAGGQMVPTEEAPSPVEPAPQTGNSTGAAEPFAPDATTGFGNDTAASPIPEPASGGQMSNDGGLSSPEPLPLPMPPAPGNDGTQGSMPEASDRSVASNDAGAEPPTPATNEAAAMSAEQPAPANRGIAMLEPIEGTATNEGAATNEQATPPSDNEPAAGEPTEAQPTKAKTKAKTATSKTKTQTSEAQLPPSGEGLVLVPPSEIPPPAPAEAMEPLPETTATTATSTTSSTGLGSVFGSGSKKLTGKRAENASSKRATGTTTATPEPAPVTNQQVASVDTQPTTSVSQPETTTSQLSGTTTTTTTSTSGGTGFMAQVASLRSEAEARAELDRLRGTHGDLIGGLSTRITKATVAGATRYRLGFGPLPSRSQAAKLCGSLIAAGERDCAVRGL
jgi:cell division septation protein DedD